MIDQFPQFSPLSLEHRDEVRNMCSSMEPYADFNFINLFCWSENVAEVSILNNNLAIKLPDYISDATIVSLIGTNKIDDSLHSLLGIGNRLELVPQTVVDGIEDPGSFEVAEDEGGHDYVYYVDDIANFTGGKFKSKRKKLNNAKNALNGSLEVATKTEIDEKDKWDMEDLFTTWIKRYRDHLVEEDAEYKAFNVLLNNLPELEVAFTLVRDKGRLIGFSVNEIIDDDYALCHFEKVIRVHPYVGVLVVNEAAKYLSEAGCTYMNWEQDLGLPGLRKTKRSYHPVGLLKKYTVVHAS